MLSYIIISIAAFLTAGLTMYSGFGLGTLLMPVFALFFSVEVAVGVTAIVHAANNVFKIIAVGKGADKAVVIKFGVPAILAAFVGAYILGLASDFGEIARYMIGSKEAVITPLKLIMALLMFVFALFELVPALKKLGFDRKYLTVGGVLSGFFGGLSGHQGALRAAFLVKTGISAKAFVGTNAWIGFMVDVMRITTYIVLIVMAKSSKLIQKEQVASVVVAIIAAFAGVMMAKKFLNKVTMNAIQILTGVLLLGISLALGAGLI